MEKKKAVKSKIKMVNKSPNLSNLETKINKILAITKKKLLVLLKAK